MNTYSLHEFRDPKTGKTWAEFLESAGVALTDLSYANNVVGVWVDGQLVLASGNTSKQLLGINTKGKGLTARHGGAGMFGSIRHRLEGQAVQWGVQGAAAQYASVHATGQTINAKPGKFLFIPGPGFPKSAKPRDFKAHVIWRQKGVKGYLIQDAVTTFKTKVGEGKSRPKAKAGDFLGTLVKRVRIPQRSIWTDKAFDLNVIAQFYLAFMVLGKEAKIGQPV